MLAAFAFALALLGRVAEVALEAARRHDGHRRFAEATNGEVFWIGSAIAVFALVLVYPRVLGRGATLVVGFAVTTVLSPVAVVALPSGPAAIAVHVAESLQGANWMLLLLVASRSTKYLGSVVIATLAARLATIVVGAGALVLSLDENPKPAVVVAGLMAAGAAVFSARALAARVRDSGDGDRQR